MCKYRVIALAVPVLILVVSVLAATSVQTEFGRSQHPDQLKSVADGSLLTSPAYSISGMITYCSNDILIEGASVSAVSGAADTTTANTDGAGIFSLADLNDGEDYSLCAWKDGDYGNAISAYDGCLIFRYLIQSLDLDSCQLEASDVLGDCDVTPYDAALILKYIIGDLPMQPYFPKKAAYQTNWIFSIEDSCSPCPPECYLYDSLMMSYTDQNFDAVVLGDVSGNWNMEPDSATVTFNPTYDSLSGDTLLVYINIDSTEIEPSLWSAEVFFVYNPEVLTFEEVDHEGYLFSSLEAYFSKAYEEEGRFLLAGFSPNNPVSGHGCAFTVKFTYADGYDFESFSKWLVLCSTRVDEEAFVYYDCCNHDGIRGEANYDMSVNVADLTFLVDYLFFQGSAPLCPDEANADGDGGINVADLTYLVDYIFFSGPAPAPCP